MSRNSVTVLMLAAAIAIVIAATVGEIQRPRGPFRPTPGQRALREIEARTAARARIPLAPGEAVQLNGDLPEGALVRDELISLYKSVAAAEQIARIKRRDDDALDAALKRLDLPRYLDVVSTPERATLLAIRGRWAKVRVEEGEYAGKIGWVEENRLTRR